MKRYILFLLLILPTFLVKSYAQYTMDTPVDIGSGYKNSLLHMDSRSVGGEYGNIIYYKFNISSPMDIKISTCGSNLSEAQVFLYDSGEIGISPDYNSSGSITCSNKNLAYFEKTNLPTGTYYVRCDCGTHEGNLDIIIQGSKSLVGNSTVNPIDLGKHKFSFTYTDTKNTASYQNTYAGRPTNDVFYKFTLLQPMDVIISHCGSTIPDTYLHLLNSYGDRIAYNDDYTGTGKCSNTAHSYLKMNNLTAGTYYVVSEGYSQNGNITTTIQGISSLEPSMDQNFILTSTPIVASPDANKLTNESCIRTVQYFDGLGRPNQTIQIGVNPDKHDLVSHQLYDAYGRESESWLPVVVSGNKGTFVPFNNAIQNYARSTYNNEPKAYTQTRYENSPLNRVLEEYGPGIDWQDNGKSVKTEYMSNTTNDCRLYKFTGTNNSIRFALAGSYAANELYVTKICDEDDKNVTYKFDDKLGQVILTRQMNNGDPHDTYYVYDDYGNLRVVIPPMLADSLPKLKTTWDDTTPIVQQYAYLYKYDEWNRCIGKKLPGVDWISYVYDKADQLIFSQDGEQRKAGVWRFSLPDALGREVVTGTFTTLKIGTTTKTITPGCLDGVVVTAVFDKDKGTLKGYTTAGITLETYTVLTASYYDNYEFMGSNGIPAATDDNIKYETVSGFGTRYTTSYKGLLTGTITTVLDHNNMIYVVMYYDYRGRVIQTKSNNHLVGGKEKEYIAYNFSGQPTKKRHIHMANGKATQTEEYTYTYDHAGRLTQTTHSLNSAPAVVLASNKYDKVGRLASSKKGNLPETKYTYNIRSWVKQIYTADLFDEELFYNEKQLYTDKQVANTPLYNGNITAMTWRIRAPRLAGLRGYTFTYDDLSQLKIAKYQYNNSPNYWDYHTVLAYDKNGNTTNIYRLGRGDDWGDVDNALLTYNGNQLIKLKDTAPDIKSPQSGDIKDYQKTEGIIEYTYNDNGAMTSDLNKGITNISYNLLNLPKQLDINNPLGRGRNIYKYTADGTKLQVKQLTGASLKTADSTDYVGNKVYENGSLKRILVDGGYISMPDKTYYHYLTDHLGSVRLVVKSSDATIAQEMDYYPFGAVCGQLSEADQSFQPYKYNGKEMDRMAGLNVYDYGARYMDPAIGRFTTIDPLAEKYYSISPYAYCGNNPVNRIDPNGKNYVNTNGEYVSEVDEIEGNKGNYIEKIKRFFNGLFSFNIDTSSESARINTVENYNQQVQTLTDMNESVETVNDALSVVVPTASVAQLAAAISAGAGAEAIALASASVVLDVASGGKGKVASKGLKIIKKTVAEQALEIAKEIGKNSVKIATSEVMYSYDLRGATHKEVETPHVQRYLKNVRPKDGKVFWNKDLKWVRPMEQQDLRTIKRILKQRK